MSRAASHILLVLAALAVSAGAPATLGCQGMDCDCSNPVLDLTVLDSATSQPITAVKFYDGVQQLTGIPAECDPGSGEVCDQWTVYPPRIAGAYQIMVTATGYVTQTISITVGTGLDGCGCSIVTEGDVQTVQLTAD